jgi:hypothetical protein
MKKLYIILSAIVGVCYGPAFAQDNPGPTTRPDSHAPIGVMGDHLHKKGEFMLSYRYMNMKMEDNRDATDDLTPETIVTTVPNRFFGNPMQPPTLRVVPTEMTMHMHMFGLMYAPANWITLMAMTMIVNQEMSHITFQGGMGTNQLGTFVTEASGLGDTRLTALIKLLSNGNHRLHLNAGISFPTGSITEEDDILTPMDMRPMVRIPYPMQLGSGTFDLLPGITYYSHSGNIGWGGQLMGNVRLGENDEEYSLGNTLQVTAWGSYMWAPWISTAARLTRFSQGKIDGIDPTIKLPVQTADPDFQGGNRLDGCLSVNLIGQKGFILNHRLAIEYGVPLMQDLNGPQMKVKSNLVLGWQYAF